MRRVGVAVEKQNEADSISPEIGSCDWTALGEAELRHATFTRILPHLVKKTPTETSLNGHQYLKNSTSFGLSISNHMSAKAFGK
jgi:hypothetical protein